ncbi:MAG TPA: VCBS repeat-containing protein [Thermoanaerobaculia bacterium]|nr:VCBS repeat-containing protein [Thermoanaerobaculia bacterium]
MNKTVARLCVLAAASALGCTSSTPSPGASGAAAPTPTPSVLSRVNPYVIEETDTYTIQRYPKTEYYKVDERHFRHPILNTVVEFFREDELYYYVSVPKFLAEEDALRRGIPPTPTPAVAGSVDSRRKPGGPAVSEFDDLQPPRSAGRLRLEKVTSHGLPTDGLWRASFELADMNGDRILDIVAPPPRISGEPVLRIWIGAGKGHFSRWPLRFTEGGKEKADPGLDYGGVAVGDIDKDGDPDVAAASHGGGLAAFYGDGKGGFRISREGLPGREFSSQAVILLDANRDGLLDMVASRDMLGETSVIDRQQVRLYVNLGPKGWQFHDGIPGGFYSNSLHAWDHDGDGLKDVLTGSHYNGALTLLWRNEGTGNFTPVLFQEIELYSYHFATAPGTYGPARAPAFADSIHMGRNEPDPMRATGISVYAFQDGKWSRHRVWRKKEGKSLQYAIAMGDLDGDKLDDVVFPDSEQRRLRVFFQTPAGTFVEAEEREEPALASVGQSVRLADLDGDGDSDVVLARTVSSSTPDDTGGWDIYLNRR